MQSLPCSILSLDIQDVMGSHSVNIHGNMVKHRLDASGKTIETEKYKTTEHGQEHSDEPVVMPDYNLVKDQVVNQEGCRIEGYFVVNKVPGNFHISSHAYGPIIQQLFREGVFTFDASHKVHHLSFGEDAELKVVKNTFGLGEISPLDKTYHLAHDKKTYEYYMKVVPTTFIDLDANTYYVHQFISNSNQVSTHMSLPAVYFR